MVDSVSSSNSNSLLRAQQAATTAALKSNQAIAQTILNKTQQSPTVAARSTNVTQLANATPPSSNLPRGSIVDVLV